MRITYSQTDEGTVLVVEGMMKKNDGMRLADEIDKAARAKPHSLILDLTSLAAVSFDSVPFIVSALERCPLGKNNVIARGANDVVERTFRGSDFERVGKFES